MNLEVDQHEKWSGNILDDYFHTDEYLYECRACFLNCFTRQHCSYSRSCEGTLQLFSLLLHILLPWFFYLGWKIISGNLQYIISPQDIKLGSRMVKNSYPEQSKIMSCFLISKSGNEVIKENSRKLICCYRILPLQLKTPQIYSWEWVFEEVHLHICKTVATCEEETTHGYWIPEMLKTLKRNFSLSRARRHFHVKGT